MGAVVPQKTALKRDKFDQQCLLIYQFNSNDISAVYKDKALMNKL